jgi:hypothetical protein
MSAVTMTVTTSVGLPRQVELSICDKPFITSFWHESWDDVQNAIAYVTVGPLWRVSDKFKILKPLIKPLKHGIDLNKN